MDTWFSLEYFTWVPLRLHGLGGSPCTVLRSPAPAIKVRKELLPSLLLVALVSCREVWLETRYQMDSWQLWGLSHPLRAEEASTAGYPENVDDLFICVAGNQESKGIQ